jgi:hypothetical protein
VKKFFFFAVFASSLVSCQTVKPPGKTAVAPPAQVSKVSQKGPLSVTPKKPAVKPYPLEKCLVSDEPLDEWDDMQTIIHEGQEMKFCCAMCLKKFKASPDKYLAMLPTQAP